MFCRFYALSDRTAVTGQKKKGIRYLAPAYFDTAYSVASEASVSLRTFAFHFALRIIATSNEASERQHAWTGFRLSRLWADPGTLRPVHQKALMSVTTEACHSQL